MRAFFCIPLNRNVAASVDRTAQRLRAALDMRANWVRAENYHVTLRFLGDIDPALTIDLQAISRRIAGRLEPFSLQLDRLGCFPSIERARVLWFGGEAPPAYRGLVASLRHELERLGFPREREQSVAHVTLARVRGRPDTNLQRTLDVSLPTETVEVHVRRIVLMESILRPTGAMYAPLFTTSLHRGEVEDGV